MISKTDMAWMAGVLDVRGKFVLKTGTRMVNRERIAIVCCSTDEALMRAICGLAGVQPYTDHKHGKEFKRLQCSRHCPADHVHVAKMTSTRFEVTGVSAFIIASALRPYLRCSQEECEEVCKKFLLSQWNPSENRGRQASIRSTARLQSLGWPIPRTIKDALEPVA